MFLSFFLFFFSLVLIVFYSVHYIYLLILLELLLLSVFLSICMGFLLNFGLAGLFLFLLVMVCMGGFSISLLVSLARLSGRDFWYCRFVF